jgi:tripartite ATP-independent transporter DctP family solute receptor
MKRFISRRTFAKSVATAVTAAAVYPRNARAAEFSYKLAFDFPSTHPVVLRSQEAADRIREMSGGRVEIRTFPNSQLGGDPDMLSQVRSGAIEMLATPALVLGGLVPAANISGIGYAFKNYDQVWTAMDGRTGELVRAQIEKVGLVPMRRMLDSGFREFTSATKPIRDPEDLQGFKMRIPSGALWTSLFQALGASPTTVNSNEVVTALQTKLVDGLETSLENVLALHFYVSQKYCSISNHMWGGLWMVVNRSAWTSLPASLQDLVSDNFEKAILDQRADNVDLNRAAVSELQSKGLVFNDTDPSLFQDVIKKKSFYSFWKGRFDKDLWSSLQDVTGSLADRA